jgi:hypothetical protein
MDPRLHLTSRREQRSVLPTGSQDWGLEELFGNQSSALLVIGFALHRRLATSPGRQRSPDKTRGAAKIIGGDQGGATLPLWTSTIRTVRCPPGSAGMCSICHTGFITSSAFATLAFELGLVWMLFLPRRWRLLCFLIVTPWELGVILTANYTFLNYLVLTLGFLLLDDRFLLRFFPRQ